MAIWAAAGALFLGLIAAVHFQPDRSAAEAVEYFNVQRLDRLPAKRTGGGRPRVIVVGTSLTLCGLYFDEDMERLAALTGAPSMDFVRFVKLDGSLTDFSPLLPFIANAEPDIVFFESTLFLIDSPRENEGRRGNAGFLRQEIGDDRKKLQSLLRLWSGRRTPIGESLSPNSLVSARRVFTRIPDRRTQEEQDDLERFARNAGTRMKLRPVSLPGPYASFLQDLQRRGVPVVLLDIPRTPRSDSTYPPEILRNMSRSIAGFQEAYGLGYLACPFRQGPTYYKDIVHLNARGRDVYCRWFLSQLPGLLKKGMRP